MPHTDTLRFLYYFTALVLGTCFRAPASEGWGYRKSSDKGCREIGQLLTHKVLVGGIYGRTFVA